MRRKIPILLVLGVAVLLALPLAAQSVSEGTITGTVYVSTGEVLPGVALTLKGPALVTGERTATSDARGRFVFMSVPAGTYDLTAGLAGFKTVTETGIVLPRGSSIDVTFRMEIGSVEESITVTSVSPVVDTRSSTVSTTFSNDLLSKVPTARNAFYDLSLTAPGMGSVGAEESWLPSPSAYGSANSNNIMLVNGVNTTNPRGSAWGSLVSVNYNTVEEVKVLSLGTKAEYGNYSGAAIDVITKSGGNEFHGDVAYYSMVGDAGDNFTTDVGGDWMFADPELDTVTRPVDSTDASVTFGGPIVKDALWFYAGYGNPDSTTDTPLRPVDETYSNKLYDLKLTGDFAANHRLWIGLHYEDTEGGGTTWGNGWDASMIYNWATETFAPQLQYQWVMGPSDILGFKFLMFDSDQTPSVSGVTGHPGYINWWKWLPQRDMGTGGDFPYIEAQKSKRQTYQADLSHYAEDFLGEHDLKFGVQYTLAEGNWLNGYFQNYANFAYPYGWNYSWQAAADWPWNTGSHWFNCETECWPMYNRVVEQYPGLTVREADSAGAFFDDTWVINDDFTVNLGLRYDRMTAKYGEGEIYEYFDEPSDINNPTFRRTRAGTDDIFDWKTWSPRIGMAWTLTDDKKTVLRAHLGRYYATMGVDSLRRFGPDAEPYLQNTWLYFLPPEVVDLNGNGYWDPEETPNAMRSLYGRTPDMNIGSTLTDPSYTLEVEPGTGSPYTDQFNISFQRQLASDLAIEFSYIYKKEQDLLALRPYDVGTGEFFEYEELPFTTWTGYQTSVWQIVPKDYNGDGVVDSGDWQYVATSGNVAYRVVNAQDFVGSDVDRTYTGLQLVLNKRYSNRWQMLAAINWTKTDGCYPRTVDQNWYIDGPIVMDTPFGASRSDFQNNLEGPAGMTPEWMIKVSGSYTIPVIETDFGFRARYDSGRAFFPIQDIPIYATWMGSNTSGVFLETGWRNMMVATDPNDPDWFPSSTIFDFSLAKTFNLGDVGQLMISFDALNALNEDAPNRAVYSSSNYGLVTSLVLPRTYRVGVKFAF